MSKRLVNVFLCGQLNSNVGNKKNIKMSSTNLICVSRQIGQCIYTSLLLEIIVDELGIKSMN